MNTTVFIIPLSQESPPQKKKSSLCTGAKSIPGTQFVVFKSHFPLKEARQLLREIPDAQPEAEAALAESRDHGMAETNDTVKESRVVSHRWQRRRQEKRCVPPDEEAEGHRGSCHRDQLQSGRVFGRSRDRWNLSHKHAASQGQHGTLA